MRSLLGLLLLCASIACAQQRDCKFLSASVDDKQEGLATQSLRFADLADPQHPVEVTAHLYLPNRDGKLPVVLFTHSVIHKGDKSTDLVPLARAIARTGAAVLVIDRTVRWEPLDDAENTRESVTRCAAQWMAATINLDPERLVVAGIPPRHFVGDRYMHFSVVGFARTSSAEYTNTEMMLSREGQLKHAAVVSRWLDLPEIDPAWLDQPATVARGESVNRP